MNSRGTHISIHALRVEGDIKLPSGTRRKQISIHALRVEGDSTPEPTSTPTPEISIHALRVEGDPSALILFIKLAIFLSTPSGWRATALSLSGAACVQISIHALRVEGDR